MSAEWREDPTARHQLRWWDGEKWTDHVADNGVTATDAYSAAPAAPPAPPPAPALPADDKGTVVFAAQTPSPVSPTSPSTPGQTPASPAGAPSYLGGGAPAPSPASSPTSSSSKASRTTKASGKKKAPGNKKVLVAALGGVVLAAAIVVVVVVVVGGGDGGGGDSSSLIAVIDEEEVLGLRISGDQGDVVIVDADPEDDVDVVTGLILTEDQLRDFYEEFSDALDFNGSFGDFQDTFVPASDLELGDLEDDFSDGYVVQENDNASEGGRERTWMVLPVDGEYAVITYPYDGSGEVELSVERCDTRIDVADLIDARDEDEEYDLIQDACGDTRIPRGS